MEPTTHLPTLRRDVSVFPVKLKDSDQTLLFFSDPLNLSQQPLSIPSDFEDLLSIFYSGLTLEDILSQFPKAEQAQLRELITDLKNLLNQHYLLDNEAYRIKMDQIETSFEKSTVRYPTLAGTCYPAEAEQIKEEFSGYFAPLMSRENLVESADDTEASAPYALYAPHIDIRVASDSYARSFARIVQMKPKHVYIIGTSHYAGYYPQYDTKPIIFSEKDFQTPLGLIPNNREKTSNLFQESGSAATKLDRAHRIEHSLEIQLIFLQYLWSHEFTITPILIGSLDELLYFDKSEIRQSIHKLSKALHNSKQEDELILISGDLSHVGLKFGDSTPGNQMLSNVQPFDQRVLETASSGNPDHLLNQMKSNYDAYRVCGYPPLYSFLSGLPDKITGDPILYDYWDDSENKSIVTFGSILFKESKQK